MPFFTEKAPDPPQDVKVLMTGHDFAVCQWTPPAPKEDADAKYYTVQYTEQGQWLGHSSKSQKSQKTWKLQGMN